MLQREINVVSEENISSTSIETIAREINQESFLKTLPWRGMCHGVSKTDIFLLAWLGNVVAQTIISGTTAETTWTPTAVINSLEFSALLIGVETLIEPHIFSSLFKTLQWIKSKWNRKKSNINIGNELLKIGPLLLLLSYVGVVLDKESNNLLDSFYSLSVCEETFSEFLSLFANMCFHGAMISTLEKAINELLLLLGCFKSDKKVSNHIDIEDTALLIPSLEEKNNISWWEVPLFPILLLISSVVTWVNENFIDSKGFIFKKFLKDIPAVIGGVELSVVSSYINCAINGEDIPFLPNWNKVKTWFGYGENIVTVENKTPSTATSTIDEKSIYSNDNNITIMVESTKSSEIFEDVSSSSFENREKTEKNDESEEEFHDCVSDISDEFDKLKLVFNEEYKSTNELTVNIKKANEYHHQNLLLSADDSGIGTLEESFDDYPLLPHCMDYSMV